MGLVLNAFIQRRRLYATTVFEALESVSADSLLVLFGTLLVELSSEVGKIWPKHDADKNAVHDYPLHCIPFAFVATREGDFVGIVRRTRPRLEIRFSASEIYVLEAGQRQLQSAVSREPELNRILEEQNDAT